MSAAYWSQWSGSELMSMHGVEDDEDCDIDCNEECESDEDCCPRCTGRGCNYCMMVDW